MSTSGEALLEQVDLAALTARFAARLHAADVPVTAERAGWFAAALSLAAPATLSELRWLGRVTLVADRSHIAVFQRVFDEVFAGLVDPAEFRGDAAVAEPPSARRAPRASPSPGAPRPRGGGAHAPAWVGDTPSGPDAAERELDDAIVAARSEEERLRHRDFSALTDEEVVRLRTLGRALSLAPPSRVARRTIAAARGHEIDVRATLRRARRTGGEPFAMPRRSRRSKPRRLVFLCDISGSMEGYARAYLHLLVSGAGPGRAEAFVFATRLTRLTRILRDVPPDTALERAGRLAPDWSGGTRIGVAMKAFNDEYGRRGVARGAVVVVLSDGWDTANPEVLGREMARLRRLAHRVVWVNPRKASPAYEPLAGGMAAALPYVDAFVSGHSHAALDEVVKAIAAS